jgi:hypothetical protein
VKKIARNVAKPIFFVKKVAKKLFSAIFVKLLKVNNQAIGRRKFHKSGHAVHRAEWKKAKQAKNVIFRKKI